MKFILIGDLHVGVGKDDSRIQKTQLEFVQFVSKYAVDNGITTAIQTGDWFDNRSGVSQESMRFQRQELNEHFKVFDDVYVIVGNHDAHLKNTLHPNSVREVLGGYLPFHVIEDPTTVQIGSTLWDLIPWECTENKQQIRDFISKSESDYNVGHWELGGFDFYKGITAHGEDADFLERYKRVYSGHYHTSSKKGNVMYVGTPYTLTMGDANEIRGFWVVDTETNTHEFVANPTGTMHITLTYNDVFDPSVIATCAGKYVRLNVHKSDDKLNGVLSQFEDVCEDFAPKYLEDLSVADIDESDDVNVNKVMDTIQHHVSSLDRTDEEKSRIMALTHELYAEACAV